MEELEQLLRESCPADLEAGPHRERLARLLRERAGAAGPAVWSARRYAMAFSGSVLCLFLAVLVTPKITPQTAWSEERQLLASMLPEETAGRGELGGGSLYRPVPAARIESPPPQQDAVRILKENQALLQEVLND